MTRNQKISQVKLKIQQITATTIVEVVKGVLVDIKQPNVDKFQRLTGLMTVQDVLNIPNYEKDTQIITEMVSAASGRMIRHLCTHQGIDVAKLSPSEIIELVAITDGIEQQAVQILLTPAH